MRWTPGGDRSNIEDRRGAGGGFGGGGFGGGGMRMGLGGTIILLILSAIFGRNFIGGGGGTPDNGAVTTESGGTAAPANESAEEKQLVDFVAFVLNDAQDTWRQILPRSMNQQYQDTRLVLFRQGTETGCGYGQSAMGPFYCPLDQKLYIDLSFYDELRSRFGANGDFAQAYVITHELGHHVQHLLGMDQRVRQAQEQNPRLANQLSVKLELQADCYAGVWGNSTNQRRILEQGDIEEGLNAAASIGDDRLQKMATGRVNTESFTHGTSEQRQYWFKHGLDTGDPRSCDTFNQRGP